MLMSCRAVRMNQIKNTEDLDFQKVVDESVINGTYTLLANYRDKNSHEITFDIQYEGDEEQSAIQKIPLRYDMRYRRPDTNQSRGSPEERGPCL